MDPKTRDFRRFAGATVLTPNLLEAKRAAGCDDDCDWELERIARRILPRIGTTSLLITRGADGMSLYHSSRHPLHIGATARAVFDVTGAGDTVVGTLALALGKGYPLEAAIRLANAAAGVTVGKVGAATLTPEELFSQANTGWRSIPPDSNRFEPVLYNPT